MRGKAQINKRINGLEKYNDQFEDVLQWCAEGRYYDELSPEEQVRYDKYKTSLGGADTDKAYAYVMNVFADEPKDNPYHFKITAERLRPPTKEEHERTIKEIEKILLEMTRKENQENNGEV